MRSDGTGRAAVIAALTEAALNPLKPGSPGSVLPTFKELGSVEFICIYIYIHVYRYIVLRVCTFVSWGVLGSKEKVHSVQNTIPYYCIDQP